MKKPILIALAFLLLFCMAGCILYINVRGTFQIDDLDKGINEETNFRFVRQAQDSTYWALFGSDYYGFNDYWVARSKDRKAWEKLFTGEHIYSDEQMRFYIVNGTLKVVEPDVRYRTIFIPIDQLDIDSDSDGLTDIEEKRLWTDPYRVDTDGDGLSDALDKNPLVGKKDSLDERQKLIKQDIEAYLRANKRKQTFIVEVNRGEDKMEFESPSCIVLCLTEREALNYRDQFGYHIRLINAVATIKGNIAEVEFTSIKGTCGITMLIKYEKDQEGKWITTDGKIIRWY